MPTTTHGSPLEFARQASGLHHVLAGDGLELQLETGAWVVSCYEWSFREGTRPLLFVGIAGGGQVSSEVPEAALMRWPGER